MKNTKRIAITLIAGLLLQQPVLSQPSTADTNAVTDGMVSNVIKLSTNPDSNTVTTPSATPAPAGSTAMDVESNSSTVVVESNSSVTIAASNPPAMVTTSNTVTVTESNSSTTQITSVPVPEVTNTLPLTGSNPPGSTMAVSAPPGMTPSNAPVVAATAESQPAPVSTNAPAPAVMPIQFTDVPLDVAIQALAREADINYLLDPSIGWGSPDQNGQVKQPPTLSVRWDNVTPEQALLALLDNYGLQLTENPKTKIAKISVRSPDQLPPLITRVVQLKYASTSNMMFAVQNVLTDKRSRIIPDMRTSQLVIVATDPEQSTLDTLIDELDKPTRQVLIETRLVELSSNPSTQKGIDWSGTLQAQNFSFGNGVLNASASSASTTTYPGSPVTTTIPGFGGHPASTTTSSPGSSSLTTLASEPQSSLAAGGLMINTLSGLTPDAGFLSADGVKAVFSFLNQSSEAQVVSTPRLVTLDNEMATIQVTREFPVINVTASTQNTAGGSTISYSNIGTILYVTPRITANDYIWLKVVPDVSTFFGTDTKTIAGTIFQADVFDSRHIETQVLIPNAHTLVMGGLVQDNPNAGYTKVPLLGDIPGLGFFFRSENNSIDKDNLLIFITPTIVRDSDFKPMQTDFLDSTPRTMADPMKMNSWWDSAQPRGNWSNPITPQQEPMAGMETNQVSTSQ
ncbi:MAG TPA: secretin N-terminal domain-containing protein [Verrucomicrobiae bacterium]